MSDYLYMMTEICPKCPHNKTYRIGINCTYKSKKQFGIENCKKYEAEKELCNHESHFISSMDRCEKCGDDKE